ncbi:hypothetical protein BC833DRAFT_367033 [Globomyces pollinis-pini]|nr:hypothetical protein BC833DRAFT_367033 [Globomyces pollinis-pini]
MSLQSWFHSEINELKTKSIWSTSCNGSIISLDLASKAKLPLFPVDDIHIQIGDDLLAVPYLAKDVPIKVDSYQFLMDLYVFPKIPFHQDINLIFGMDFLSEIHPYQINKTQIVFKRVDKTFVLPLFTDKSLPTSIHYEIKGSLNPIPPSHTISCHGHITETGGFVQVLDNVNLNILEPLTYPPHNTNRAHISAVISALQHCFSLNETIPIIIKVDNQYILDSLDLIPEWKLSRWEVDEKIVPNRDLLELCWNLFQDLLETHDVKFQF